MEQKEGDVLTGRYRIMAFLGRGGMAEVYKVWDKDRSVALALKLLHADLAQDRVFLRRFKREAVTLSRLQHPNIVRFYGLEQDGLQAFILMDYIDGNILRSEIFQLNGTPMPAGRILEIMRPVCAALHYAHQVGVVHCDVKPANIMIDRSGKVLVADFGIARMAEGATTTTLVGAGTPAYMAPELVRGENPSPQTDIYALGIILFEMLTGGERPFTGEQATITGTTGEKVRWEQVHARPIALRQFNPRISPELEGVVARCLEKDPHKRFPDTLDLLSAIEKAVFPVRAQGTTLSAERPDADVYKKSQAEERQRSASEDKARKVREEIEKPAVEKKNRQEQLPRERDRQAEEQKKPHEELSKAWLSARWAIIGIFVLIGIIVFTGLLGMIGWWIGKHSSGLAASQTFQTSEATHVAQTEAFPAEPVINVPSIPTKTPIIILSTEMPTNTLFPSSTITSMPTDTATPIKTLSPFNLLPSEIAYSEWPMQGQNPGNTYSNLEEKKLKPPLNKTWEYNSIYYKSFNTMAISRGVVIIAGDEGEEAIDALSRKSLWSHASNDFALYDITPVIYMNLVIIPNCQRDGIFALGIKTGVQEWYKNGFVNTFSRSPRVVNDVLYVSSSSGMFALNPLNGEQIWQQSNYGNNGSYYSQAPFAVYGSFILGGGLWSPLQVLDIKGNSIWSTKNLMHDTVLAQKGIVYIDYSNTPVDTIERRKRLSGYSFVAAFDIFSGKIIWETEISAEQVGNFVLGDGILYVRGYKIFDTTGNGTIYALKLNSGTRLFSRKIQGYISAYANGVLYVAGEKLQALDPKSLDTIWEENIQCQDLAIAYGKLYCLSGNGFAVFENNY